MMGMPDGNLVHSQRLYPGRVEGIDEFH